MFRFACAIVGTLALLATDIQRGRADVDAVTFALAFHAGNADQYKNKQITGVGMNFHGAIQERIADGSTRTSLVMTLGSVDSAGKLKLLSTREDFIAAERARTTLVVALSGPNLEPSPTLHPTVYEFSGVYDGQVRTIARAPQAVDPTLADSGPCPGERPRDAASQSSFYCAPLLTGATATPKR